jgi:hypothetical protein
MENAVCSVSHGVHPRHAPNQLDLGCADERTVGDMRTRTDALAIEVQNDEPPPASSTAPTKRTKYDELVVRPRRATS